MLSPSFEFRIFGFVRRTFRRQAILLGEAHRSNRRPVLNIASKLFGENKPVEVKPKSEEAQGPTLSRPSGFFSCVQHPELLPMSINEFDNHKTAHDMANTAQKSANVHSWGVVGLWKNTSIRPCEAAVIPEGDPRLLTVPSGQTTHGYVVVKEVVREVLVSCRHCGARYLQGTPRCLTCGANL